MSTCLILDCFSLVYRSFFGLPTSIKRQDGQIINAVLGFYNTLTALMEQFQPDYLFVASDHPSPTFRHELFPDYKQHRPPMPEELRGQIELIEEVIASFSVPMIKFPGYEADDIMGTLANYAPAGTHCYIVTTDRDALQLVSDEITVVAPNSRANKMYTPEIVQYELGVSPALVPHYKALVGDTSDNIPGIPLVGPKTAVKWLNMFGSLDDLLQNADLLPGKAGQNLAANRDKARLYLELTTIDRNVPTYCCWHAGRLAFAEQEVRRTLESLGIRASIPTLA
ncbi:MAG TPA: 5'-3' exonuclease H3TH domain-containing protein [Limnochordia bacterium]|nr:5'-3' exonuclease H3TH domain-containing protein [Limnochordia bacterium]